MFHSKHQLCTTNTTLFVSPKKIQTLSTLQLEALDPASLRISLNPCTTLVDRRPIPQLQNATWSCHDNCKMGIEWMLAVLIFIPIIQVIFKSVKLSYHKWTNLGRLDYSKNHQSFEFHQPQCARWKHTTMIIYGCQTDNFSCISSIFWKEKKKLEIARKKLTYIQLSQLAFQECKKTSKLYIRNWLLNFDYSLTICVLLIHTYFSHFWMLY